MVKPVAWDCMGLEIRSERGGQRAEAGNPFLLSEQKFQGLPRAFPPAHAGDRRAHRTGAKGFCIYDAFAAGGTRNSFDFVCLAGEISERGRDRGGVPEILRVAPDGSDFACGAAARTAACDSLEFLRPRIRA